MAKMAKDSTYLKMKMNRISNEKKMATLSIVRSITNSWRRKFGINLTNLRILSRRNVRRTLRPEFPSRSPKNDWHNSIMLKIYKNTKIRKYLLFKKDKNIFKRA